MKTQHTCATKPDARSDAVNTNITFDWDGVTDADKLAMCTAWCAIKLQIGFRKNGIPSEYECKVRDIVPGTRAPRGPVDPIALAKKMSPEELVAFIAQLHSMAAQ